MTKKFIVGILSDYSYDNNLFSVNKRYIDACLEIGAVPVIVSPALPVSSAVELANAFIFTGGGDFSPQLFHEEPIPANGRVNPLRDSFEIALARQCFLRRIPCLGICRGMQVLNIAAGGTIYQDIYSYAELNPIQHIQLAPKNHCSHTVYSQCGSLIEKIYGKEFGVNSFHHQAIKKLGEGFIATSFSCDGIIESIEHNELPFVVGVQWHPEHLFSSHATSKALFQALLHPRK